MGKQTLFGILVIALTTVITVQCGSVAPGEQQAAAEIQPKESAPATESAKSVASPSAVVGPKTAAAAEAKPEDTKPDIAPPADTKLAPESEQEANARKGRSEPPPSPTADTKVTEKPAEGKVNEKDKAMPTSKPAAEQKQKPTGKQQLAAKSGSTGSGAKNKLPANLGTVTSTGSGGPAHYMSKHDAYSAIAEKHGALAQDAMRKSDKRRLQHFGGIQKASGLGDMFSPFKGVTDSGLARSK